MNTSPGSISMIISSISRALTGYPPRAVVSASCNPESVNLPFFVRESWDKESHLKRGVKHGDSESIEMCVIHLKYTETQLSDIPIVKIS